MCIYVFSVYIHTVCICTQYFPTRPDCVVGLFLVVGAIDSEICALTFFPRQRLNHSDAHPTLPSLLCLLQTWQIGVLRLCALHVKVP